MNKWIGIGRLTRDPEIRYTNGDDPMCIARYTLAVDRRVKKDGQDNADFINCVAFGKAGEFVEKYCKKGTKLAVSGRIQTGSYTNRDGVKVYTTEVVVEDQEFAESRNSSAGSGSTSGNTGADRREAGSRSNSQQASAKSDDPMDGFMNIPDGIDEELPFA